MTDVQDAILDRLVGAKIGVNWPGSPLAIAADYIGGPKPIYFLANDNRGAKAEIARRLGYPVLLIEAMQGGNRAFAAEDDRRAFAMAVFRKVSVGGKLPRLSTRDQNLIAGRLAVRAHAYVCPAARCPVVRALTALLDAPEPTEALIDVALDSRCKTTKAMVNDFNVLRANSPPSDRVMKSAEMAVTGLMLDRSLHGWCSARESVRLAASERGIEEAVDCCVEVARQCGVPVVE
jgi:hypothetical protein